MRIRRFTLVALTRVLPFSAPAVALFLSAACAQAQMPAAPMGAALEEAMAEEAALDAKLAGLPQPAVVLSGVETLALSSDEYGSMTIQEAPGLPWDHVARVTVDQASPNTWDFQAGAPTTSAVEDGDVLMMRFYWRVVTPQHLSGMGQTQFVFEKGSEPYTKSLEWAVSSTGGWEFVYKPFTCRGAFEPGEANANFRLGYGDQVVEIAGLLIQNYGKEVQVSDLPEQPRTYIGREPDAPWRKLAGERIDQLRKADLSVQVITRDGLPIEGAEVSVEMKRHAFGFGTAVAVHRVASDTPENEKYREMIVELFNRITTGNDLKWQPWIGEWGQTYQQGNTLEGLEWLHDQGLLCRGHVLVWPGWSNLPRMLREHEGDPEMLRQLIREHIEDVAGATREYISEWDVINEPFTNHDLMDILGREAMVDWFEIAREVVPDAQLFINDYGIMTAGGNRQTGHYKSYLETIRYLLEEEAPIGGIGLQGHFGWQLASPESLWLILDEYGSTGLPIQITEFDINITDEQLQADYTRDFMTAVFAHPSVSDFIMWGFWVGDHWLPDAAMVRADWSFKPNGEVYRDLVFDEWWTEETGKTDKNGILKLRGFKGDYEITVKTRGREYETRRTLGDEGLEFRMIVD